MIKKNTIYPSHTIKVSNNSTKEQKLKLFGFNINFSKPNFGIPKGVLVENVGYGLTKKEDSTGYKHLCSELHQSPRKISVIEISSSSKKQLEKSFFFCTRTSNGDSLQREVKSGKLNVKNDFRLNVNSEYTFGGDSYMEFSVLAKTSIIVSILVQQK